MTRNSIQLLPKDAIDGARCLFALSRFVSSYRGTQSDEGTRYEVTEPGNAKNFTRRRRKRSFIEASSSPFFFLSFLFISLSIYSYSDYALHLSVRRGQELVTSKHVFSQRLHSVRLFFVLCSSRVRPRQPHVWLPWNHDLLIKGLHNCPGARPMHWRHEST